MDTAIRDHGSHRLEEARGGVREARGFLAGVQAAAHVSESSDRLGDAIDGVLQWQQETFGDRRNVRGCLAHMIQEAEECLEAFENGTRDDLEKEFADVIFMALQGLDLIGSDAATALTKKLRIVGDRTYLPPDAQGVMRHSK